MAGNGSKVVREYKDTVFGDLFYSDETAPENALSLFNALHGTSIMDVNSVHKARLDNILYLGQHNDSCILMLDEMIDLWEGQASINPNMALRLLMYIGREYESIVDARARYGKTLVKIPTPSFYVFYMGKADAPVEEIQRLSDAFMVPPCEYSVELTVRVININSSKKHPILEKCRVLKEYSLFIDAVRSREGQPDGMRSAIEECIGGGVCRITFRGKDRRWRICLQRNMTLMNI